MGAADELSGWMTMQCADGTGIDCGRLTMSDGIDLFYRSWKTDSPDLLMVVHGLGGHSGWYIGLGNALADRHLDILIPDLRGHGRSGGRRGHVRWGSRLLDDLEEAARWAIQSHKQLNQNSAARFHLLGHSMGAVLAVHLAKRLPLASLALVNPWIEDTRQVPSSLVLKILGQGMLGSTHEWRLAGGSEGMSDNLEAHAYLSRDPYWGRGQSASFLTQVLWLRLNILRAAREITAPALVIQTRGDTVVRLQASQRLFRNLGSLEKEWSTPPEYPHDFEFSADCSFLNNQLAEWLHSHASS